MRSRATIEPRHPRPRGAIRTALVVAVGVVVAACARTPFAHHPPVIPPAPDRVAIAWAATRDDAHAALEGGRYAHADSVLTAFRDRYVGMPQSAEALYWRALARLDPAIPGASVRPALADLDAYRATPAPEHLPEAVALARALAQLDSMRSLPLTVTERPAAIARAGLVSRDSVRALEDEIARAHADVAATRAELERVRRRLAAPGRRP